MEPASHKWQWIDWYIDQNIPKTWFLLEVIVMDLEHKWGILKHD